MEGAVVSGMAGGDVSGPPHADATLDEELHLLVEIARLAQQQADVRDFLASVAGRLAAIIHAERVSFYVHDPGRRLLVPGIGEGDGTASLPCDPAASDLLSQVVLAGRVFRGDLNVGALGRHTDFATFMPGRGGAVLMAPWRAGDERLGAVIAQDLKRKGGFTSGQANILIAAGHAVGLVWHRKQAELKLAERAEQAEALERAKTRFLELASHEMRGPLTLFNGYVSMLEDGTLDGERLRKVLPVLRGGVEHMKTLVDQFIDATRLAANSRVELEPVDIREVVESAASRIVGRWGRSIDFELCVPSSPVVVEVERRRVNVPVENLLDNAFKYSRYGERVRCELEVSSPQARLRVLDHGIGMSNDEMKDLFTRFGRAVNERTSHIAGVGLGLYLSREIARMHGGDIEVRWSAPGEGSEFLLTLPLAWRAGRPGGKGSHQ